MNRYLQLLTLLAFGVAGAVLWQVLSDDPGYLLLTFRGWSIETTLVVAAVLAGLLASLVCLVVRLLRSPFRILRRRRRKRARERLADGLIAMCEGHWHKAERLLQKAAAEPSQQAAAALMAARIASLRDDSVRFDEALARARDAGAEAAADAFAARHLLEAGRPASACEMLDAAARERTMCPAALDAYVDSLAACQRAADALPLLNRLGTDKSAPAKRIRAAQVEIAVQAMRQARNTGELRANWEAVARALRQEAEVAIAYAARADQLEQSAKAAEVLEALLAKHWSEPAALLYGQLQHGDLRQAIKQAERWQERHPGQPAALIALGELCRREQLWGKAEDFLQRALAHAPAATWEALGRLYRDRDDAGRAQQAFENALRAGRGESVRAVQTRARIAAERATTEQRNAMGLPLLPAQEQAADSSE